jgi:hypothetical protein
MCKAKQNHRRSTKALQEIEGERREEKHTIVASRREGGLEDTSEETKRGRGEYSGALSRVSANLFSCACLRSQICSP